MKRACVIGWPISHSRSPMIHGFWLKMLGIDGSYTRVAVEPGRVRDFLNTLAREGYAGCNVTVPHKEIAFEIADVKDASAVAVGAANTLWLDGGRLHAANTDTYGFMANLDQSAPDWLVPGAPAMVLGAGGSARAVVHGLKQRGVAIQVFNRSRVRAEELAAHFGAGVSVHDWETRNAHVGAARLIVNTTTLGMNENGDPGIDFTRAAAGTVAADLVYVPLQTIFLKAARAAGVTTVGGLGMLLHQAVPGFEKWFGIRPQVTPELYDLVAADIEAH